MEIQKSAASEVTGRWLEESSSGEELSEGSDDVDAANWDIAEEDENNSELMESMEALALSDEYRAGETMDITYRMSDFLDVQNLQRRSSVSPSKCVQNM